LIGKVAVSNDALEIVRDVARTTRVTTPAAIIRRPVRMIHAEVFGDLIVKLSYPFVVLIPQGIRRDMVHAVGAFVNPFVAFGNDSIAEHAVRAV
jgi:hypothetical protein